MAPSPQRKVPAPCWRCRIPTTWLKSVFSGISTPATLLLGPRVSFWSQMLPSMKTSPGLPGAPSRSPTLLPQLCTCFSAAMTLIFLSALHIHLCVLRPQHIVGAQQMLAKRIYGPEKRKQSETRTWQDIEQKQKQNQKAKDDGK